MDFPTLYGLWTQAQAKAAQVNGLTVTINGSEGTVEVKIAGQVVHSSTDLLTVHIALDVAIAIDAIVNP